MEYPYIRGEDFSDYDKSVTSKLFHAYIDTHIKRSAYEYLGDGLQSMTIL